MEKVLCLILAVCAVSVRGNPIATTNKITEFLILHNNDMHARFEQTSVNSGKCLPADANSNKCYGGFARVAYEIRKYRQEAANGGTPVFYLNAGDTYTGTSWFAVFKDNITAAFLNKLKPDAISLGNHEFDNKVEGLVPFLEKVDFPVLACNLDLSKAPQILNAKSFANSTVLDINGIKIGVIGYLTPDTKMLVPPNEVEIKPEIESINWVAEQMKAAGIKIIIALGHSGYQKDQEIAKNCPEVDIVIGGHTNTFLYNEEQPSTERIDGKYPTVVKQDNGKEVPVVQAYAYTKYLGKFHVQFDEDGNLIEFDGTPILLNASVPAEDDVLQLLEVYRPTIVELEETVVGHSKVFLEGACRKQECNLGNLITDALILARVLDDKGGAYWTDAPIAFIQGGGIRNGVEKRSDGSITKEDISQILPFDNDVVVTTITGHTIRNALEHSANLRGRDSDGGFLQMSGARVTYDFSKPENERVVALELRCAECDVPIYETVNNTKLYKVVVPSFLYDGGDGHVFKENDTVAEVLPGKDADILIKYIERHDFVYPEHEGRITILNANDDDHDPDDDGAATLSSSILLTILVLFINKFML